jgi:hypothetical protein
MRILVWLFIAAVSMSCGGSGGTVCFGSCPTGTFDENAPCTGVPDGEGYCITEDIPIFGEITRAFNCSGGTASINTCSSAANCDVTGTVAACN